MQNLCDVPYAAVSLVHREQERERERERKCATLVSKLYILPAQYCVYVLY